MKKTIAVTIAILAVAGLAWTPAAEAWNGKGKGIERTVATRLQNRDGSCAAMPRAQCQPGQCERQQARQCQAPCPTEGQGKCCRAGFGAHKGQGSMAQAAGFTPCKGNGKGQGKGQGNGQGQGKRDGSCR